MKKEKDERKSCTDNLRIYFYNENYDKEVAHKM